ncbi:MAG: hypothetical protein JST40_11480 [Armatimonadetes bacterium]|nr:hypothetical protein [Armatimonadota bacterium]
MKRTSRKSAKILVLLVVFTTGGMISSAQENPPANPPASPADPPAAPLTGQSEMESIRIKSVTPNIPLRHDKVVDKSEEVFLDGVPLVRDRDYLIDYDRGMIFLSRQTREGQIVRISYRHDPNQKASGKSFAGLGMMSGLGLHFAGGNQRLVFGLGMAERRADGTVATSNMYGMNNSFSFAGGSLKGLYLVADEIKSSSTSVLDGSKTNENTETGKSQAIIQNFEKNMMGGKVSFDLRDVSSKFNGFQAFREAGYAEDQIQAIAKEKGMRRTGFGLQQLGSKSFNFSSGYSAIKDKGSSIEWRTLGLTAGLLTGTWDSTRVSRTFSRFGDLANGDRDQLRREAGISRENVALNLNGKGLKGSYQTNKVEEDQGSGLFKRSAEMSTGPIKVGFSDQKVEESFTRFDATRLGDAGQLARERGQRRQNYMFGYNPAQGIKVNFNSSWLMPDQQDSSRYQATDFSAEGKNWSLTKIGRKADAGFGGFGAMADGERWANINAIGKMYQPEDFGKRGDEFGWFQNTPGVDRNGTRIAWTPFKGYGLQWNQVRLSGQADDAKLESVSLSSSKLNVKVTTANVGKEFNELGNLMTFERERLGSNQDFKRTDINLESHLTPNRTIAATQTNAKLGEDSTIRRQTFALNDRNLQFSWASRTVAPGFTGFGGFVDPERDLLAQLQGFSQSDFGIHFNAVRGLDLKYQSSTAKNEIDSINRVFRVGQYNYQLDSQSSFNYYEMLNETDAAEGLKYRNSVARWSYQRNLGKIGTLGYEQEAIRYDGTDTQAPDSKRQTISYETKLNPKTTVKTQQTEIRYDTGERETSQTHVLESEINKRTGVSVTQLTVNRDGDKPDESQRRYGFWWDFGNGMRFAYNVARNTNSTTNGNEQNQISLTPGQVGALAVGAATYSENNIDKTRFQSVGNFNVSTVKPIRFGPLQDLTLNYAADTQRDQLHYIRENRTMGAGFRIGSLNFGWDYRSQVGADSIQAIDRTFRFSTDQSDTKPLRMKVNYKIRTLPNDQQWMIRDFSFTARLAKSVEVTHQVQTNPEIARGDVILGSVPQASRSNKWKLDLLNNKPTKLGLSWEELINDQQNRRSRVGGVNVTLFANNPSPLTLFYGVEQQDNQAVRKTIHRYSLRYDQRPGPNQLFSLFLGNISYQHSRDNGTRIQNWSMRMEYQIRF